MLKIDFEDRSTLDFFLRTLKELPRKISNFEHTSLETPEGKVDLGYLKTLPVILEEVDMRTLNGLFISKQLRDYNKNRIAKLIRKMKKGITKFLESSGPDDKYSFPLHNMCSAVSGYDTVKQITITDICSSIHTCSSTAYPYGRFDGDTDVTTACTSDNKCDLEKALPMMVGVLWHAISEWIAQRLCISQCLLANCNHDESFENLVHEAKLLRAYTSILPQYFNHVWRKNFFENAVDRRAFSDLGVSLSMVEEKKRKFETTPMACYLVGFAEACLYADIYKQFALIKKVQQHRTNPGLVKDLRLHSNVNHAKMVELQISAINHIALLGNIDQLDDNLQVSVSGISRYFTGLAQYDEGIADADVTFIQGELDRYETNMADVERKVINDVAVAMGYMAATALANLAEEITTLAAKIAENCNPIKVIFTGVDVGDILEEAAEVANAASIIVRATALMISFQRLVTDSLEIGKAFNGENGNSNQITSLKTVVDQIRNNQAQNIGVDADKFIEEYGAYTPQTDRSRLERNNALWSAFKDATCEILNGEVGIAGAIPQAISGGMLICEKLEGTLAQFFTIREEIFDFQFQLVDAVANVVRGNIARRLAQNIEGRGDLLNAAQLMIGFFMMQGRLQTHSSLYCDILEYKQLGRPVDACATVNGLFIKENIDSLIAYTDHSRYDDFERDVYIPTKPRFEGDTGYIDLPALGNGESIVFKIPVNSTWLQEHRWTLHGETSVPFVKNFNIFLPHKEYKTGADLQHTTTRVTILSIAGSSVSTAAPHTGVVYILPKEHSSYVTVYEEGYSTCSSSKKIHNPYSLCKNLPKICDKSPERNAGDSLLPTILSTWHLRFTISQGSTVEWDHPSPSTNLLIRAKVTLRMLPSKKKRSHLPKRFRRSPDVMSTNGCCTEGNRYRSSWNNRKCETCPDRSTSNLGGLYCEIDEQPPEEAGDKSGNDAVNYT
jgi:hypothetical protein